MGTVTSNTFSTRAGSGYITLTHASLPTTTVQASKMGTISVEYDLEEDTEKASTILFSFDTYEASFFNKLGNGGSLFNELDSITSTDTIGVQLNFTTDGGLSISESFIMKASDVKFDYERREVSIEAEKDTSLTPTVDDIFTNNSADIDQIHWFASDPGTEDCMAINTFLDHCLSEFNSSNTNINDTNSFTSDGKSGGATYVIVRRSYANISEYLYKIAVADGSIIGSYFGYNFIVNRMSTARKATVTPDDVEKLNTSVGLNSYKLMHLLILSAPGNNKSEGLISTAVLDGDADNLNDDATKRMDIYFSIGGILEPVTWSSTNTRYEDDGGVTYNQQNIKLSSDAYEGDTIIPIDNGAGGGASTLLSAGDKIFFGTQVFPGNPFSPFYVVESQGSSYITLNNPLQSDVPDNANVYKINDIGKDALTTSALNGYAHAYGAIGTRVISADILDVDSVMPYESVEFGSGFDLGLSGSVYRPSQIEYDLDADKIKIKSMYQIA